MTVVFIDDAAFDKGRTEELVVVVPAFVGKAEEEEKDHRTKHRSPATDLCRNVESAILDPDYLWEENDTTKVGMCVRPASPGRKRVGSSVEIDLERRDWRSAHKFHAGECHQTEISAGRQRFVRG